jgi:hypothetical protein
MRKVEKQKVGMWEKARQWDGEVWKVEGERREERRGEDGKVGKSKAGGALERG